MDSIDHRICERILEEKHHCCASCVLSDALNLISKSNVFVRNYVLSFSKTIRYYRGSRFLQCVMLSTALHCSLPSKFFANNYFELLPIIASSALKGHVARDNTGNAPNSFTFSCSCYFLGDSELRHIVLPKGFLCVIECLQNCLKKISIIE